MFLAAFGVLFVTACSSGKKEPAPSPAPTEEPQVIKVTATPTTKVFNMPQVTDTPTPTPTSTPTLKPTRPVTPTPEGSKWVGTWGSAQLTPGNDTMPPSPGLSGNTYRQIVRVSISGDTVQFVFSNIFGESELELSSVHAAIARDGQTSVIDTETDTLITFDGGSESTVIPAGETLVSDPVKINIKQLEYVAITAHFGKVPKTITSHTASRSLNYLLQGDHISDAEMTGAKTATSWYFLSEIDVFTYDERCSVVCFGDSITDGYGVETGSYGRWTDVLAERLADEAATENIGVINSGIGGNSIYGGNGQAAKDRFQRDVLERAGVKYVIIFIGTNDIGFAMNKSTTDAVTKGIKDMVDKAKAQGIKVYLGTITPFNRHSYYTELHEEVRQAVNDWIRSDKTGADGVLDFDLLLRDEKDPKTMKAELANDFLHPNMKGYRAIGESIDLDIFK